MELREGAVIADRFRLIRQLGKGGMGEVWAAQHASLDIPCAVKFIHAESAQKPEVRARFEREAKAAATLRSNNVVQILDYGIFENTPYIAMEYLEGEPLSARLQRRPRLDAHETFRIIRDVARALGKAHAAGIVHRDLKPENIFLVPDEDRETAKVLDFGVAKSSDQLDSNTRTGALLGTPYFMSPEQAQGTKAVDHRADLWSLAVVTFRCLTGELPFKSTALGDLLIKIVTLQLPVPSHVYPGVSEGFDAWWRRAAERDPNLRYQNAKDFVDALGMALNVSMPSTLGNTPMPGVLARDLAPMPGKTVVADPSPSYGTAAGVMPGQAGATPFQQPFQPSESGRHPAYGAQAGYPPPHQTAPGQHGYAQAVYGQQAGYGQPQYAPPAHGMIHDSPSTASMAGMATAPRMPSSSGSGKTALVGVVLGMVLVAGGVGAFLMVRGGSTPEPTTQGAEPSKETTSSPQPSSEPSAPAPAPDPKPAASESSSEEPAPSPSPDGSEQPTTDQPNGPPRPLPVRPVPGGPHPDPLPDPVPVTPSPTPTPSPQQPKPKPDDHDPGF